METLINRGYKFKIVPTKEQKEFFLQSFGCARKIYNMYVYELYRKLEKLNLRILVTLVVS